MKSGDIHFVTSTPNNIGCVRLALACTVIVSHSAEFMYGSRAREPLYQLFGTLTLGDVAVDFFFLLSGVLITQSYLASRSGFEFLVKRAARIYPAFLLASLVAIAVEAPLIGLDPVQSWPDLTWRTLLLGEPVLNDFHLNTPAWSIIFEFRCYILTLLLGSFGAFRCPRLVLMLVGVAVLLIVLTQHPFFRWRWPQIHAVLGWSIFGGGPNFLRLTSIYLVGTAVCLYWPLICKYVTGWLALLGVAAACVTLSVSVPVAGLGLGTVGVIPMLWVCMRANLGRLRHVNETWDISYGVYLYGWIVQTLLWQFLPPMNWILFSILASTTSLVCGTLSWLLIESPAKRLSRSGCRALRGYRALYRFSPEG